MTSRHKLFATIVAVFAATTVASAQSPGTRRVATWASAQQVPEPNNAVAPADLSDATLREIVHVSLGGGLLRVRFSNAFGTQPLVITSAHVALPVAHTGAIDPTTDKALQFDGSSSLLIPAGADILSDPVDFKLPALSDLAVTFHLDRAPQVQTSHPGSRSTTFLSHGDSTAAVRLDSPKKVEHWFFLSGVDIAATPAASTFIAFGDSITDGHGSTTDGNDRWPDAFASLLQKNKDAQEIAVINEGIGGNHMLTDGLGPNALARFDRDALAPSGVSTLLLLEGVNDLGILARSEKPVTDEQRTALLHALESSYMQFVARAHAHGLRVLGATILPYVGSGYYHPSPADEAERLKLNAWIRQPGHFDGVVDFDLVTADPSHPGHLLPAYDCGDHLHPSPAGYRAMAAAIPSVLFRLR